MVRGAGFNNERSYPWAINIAAVRFCLHCGPLFSPLVATTHSKKAFPWLWHKILFHRHNSIITFGIVMLIE